MKVACFAILLLIAFGDANATLGNDHEYLSRKLTGVFKGIQGFLAKVRGIWAIDRREAVRRVHEIDTHKMEVGLGTRGHMLVNKPSHDMRKPKCSSKKCRKIHAEVRKMNAKRCVGKCRKCHPRC